MTLIANSSGIEIKVTLLFLNPSARHFMRTPSRAIETVYFDFEIQTDAFWRRAAAAFDWRATCALV